LAERELIAAARFYETRAPGLGGLYSQVERTLGEIVAHPNAGSLFASSTIRRRLIQSFPSASYTSLSPRIFDNRCHASAPPGQDIGSAGGDRDPRSPLN
jgi:hypothetical protein